MYQHFVDKVAEFHTAFKYKPKSLGHNILLRNKLLWEEYNEFKEAKEPVLQLDGLTDMIYIAAGTLEQYDPLVFHDYNHVTVEKRPLDAIMENIEFCTSFNRYLNLHIELIDAVVYTASEFNFDIRGAFDEVHRSNMSKLDDNGKPVMRSDGKILKGPNYSPPRLEQFTVKEANG